MTNDEASQADDVEVLFHEYLDHEWPGWQEFKSSTMYRILRKAFFAGAGIEAEDD